MVSWIEAYAKTHLFYIILIVGSVFSFHVWLQEHDARVQSDNAVKAQQVVVKDLQAQINAIPAQTTAKVQVITRVVHDAITPSQVVAAIPTLTQVPLQASVISGNSIDVEVAAQPLMQLVGELKTTEVQLGACQQTDTLKDQQLFAKDAEIVALKKKPKFLTRVKHVAQAVGVGIAVGLFLSTKI